MGYDLGPEFATQLSSSKSAVAGRSDWGPYAVRIRLDDPDGINLHVVRDEASAASSAENQRQRDREVEESWCADLGAVQARLAERGVDLDLVERTAPGVSPCPRSRASSSAWGAAADLTSAPGRASNVTSADDLEGLPGWGRDLAGTLAIHPQYVLWGNVRDIVLVGTARGIG